MKTAAMTIVMALIVIASLVRLFSEPAGAIAQEDLNQPRVYAYRDWQSLGIQVQQGDRIEIEADGTWRYTPEEYDGPEGSHRFGAPNFYPVPNVPGGILIGRVGEKGEPFLVGRSGSRISEEAGLLYLRINDDILSDNGGWLTVDVTLIKVGN